MALSGGLSHADGALEKAPAADGETAGVEAAEAELVAPGDLVLAELAEQGAAGVEVGQVLAPRPLEVF